MVSMLATTIIIAGFALGMRFKILALIPVMFFSTLVMLAIGVSRNEAVLSTISTTALTILTLQIAYFAGSMTHFLLARIFGRKSSARVIVDV